MVKRHERTHKIMEIADFQETGRARRQMGAINSSLNR